MQVCLTPVIDRSVVRFAFVGVANTLVGLAVIYIAMFAFGLGNVTANCLGYVVGILLSFILNRRWTFEHKGSTLPALFRFLAVTLVAYVVNLATVLVLADGLGVDRYVAQAAGMPPYTVVGYLGSRFFAFRNTRHN